MDIVDTNQINKKASSLGKILRNGLRNNQLDWGGDLDHHLDPDFFFLLMSWGYFETLDNDKATDLQLTDMKQQHL